MTETLDLFTCNNYRSEPPYNAGSETSKEAAESIAPSRGKLAQEVYEFIEARGRHGAICDEVERELGMAHQTASARVRELYLNNAIKKTERKRKTRSGRSAFVYVVEAG